MSSLYRCRARVAYKPFKYDRLIVFEDNQITNAEVVLKWDHSSTLSNSETLINAPAFYSSLSKSTCNVTINDPYLSGIAWPVLYDAASLYRSNSNNTAKSIMLPPCSPGQDPVKDKCRYYPDIDSSSTLSLFSAGTDDFPHLLLSFWYEVKGTKFGTDFYFRVVNMNITHGSGGAPSVQMQGEEARSIVFNQNLVNYGFEAGTSFEDAIEKIVKDYGYTPSFCAADYTKYGLIQPTHIRDSGVTPAEAIKRRINAAGGNILTMPTREWADKVSICTRNEVNQGCKVFYLGVGLYENYSLDGVPDTKFYTNYENTLSPGSDINNFSTYRHPIFEADEYLFDNNLFKTLRTNKLRGLKRNAFPGQFQTLQRRFDAGQATSGDYFEEAGPRENGAKTAVKKKSASDIELYGTSPSGTNSIAYLDGLLREASPTSGKVVILAKYFLYACGKVRGTTTQQCFSSPIYQEITNLSEVKVQLLPNQKTLVTMNQVVGTSTPEKPDKVRFFIPGPYSRQITIPPEIVYKFAIPEEGLNDDEIRRYIGDQPTVNTGSIPRSTGLGPAANLGRVNPTTNTNAPKILIMAGHADLRSSGTGVDGVGREVDANIRALQWVRDNAPRYGIENILEFYYDPSKTNVINKDGPDSQFTKCLDAVRAGKQVIELHHDAYNSSGKSGVIFSYASGSKIQGKVYPLDTALSGIYGSFGRSWRSDDGGLGVPNRGGTMLEVAPFTPENARRALSSDRAISDAYFKQALEPFMLSIRSQYSSNPNVTTPQPGQPQSASGGPLPVGLVGQTGRVTGPHLHVQFVPAGPITSADVSKYVEIQGVTNLEAAVTDRYGSRGGGFRSSPHGGIDFGASEGTPVFLKNGAQVVDSSGGCQNNDPECGGKCGNSVDFTTPEGKKLRLCHLAPGSVSPTSINGRTAGSGSASGANLSNTGMPTGVTTQGLHISTSFRGVPRALRIIPGRTILSFITNYDKWLQEGKPRSIDPGVWIPETFSKYFIKECTYTWKGDLRVNLSGVVDWGLTKIQTPSFTSYMEDLKSSGQIKVKDDGIGYYNYIRSLGDLCYKVAGKNSCETLCDEVQRIQAFLSANTQAEQASPSVATNYPQAPCRYNGSFLTAQQASVANSVINALYSAGLRGQNAFAGALGNAHTESKLNPGVHNSNPGSGCGGFTDRSGKVWPQTPGYGLFQWCYERQESIARKCGARGTQSSANLQCQLGFVIEELKGPYSHVVADVNSARSAEEAARFWNKGKTGNGGYESGDPSDREANAARIVQGIRCDG